MTKLQGVRICLLAWKDVTFDARTVRTATTLARAGAHVLILAACPTDNEFERSPAAEFELRLIRRPAPLPGRTIGRGVHIGALGAMRRIVRGLGAQLALLRAALGSRAQVFHACDLVPLPVAWLVSMITRKKVVYEAYEISVDREAYRGFPGLVKVVEGFLVRRIDGFITTTDSRAEFFAGFYGVPRPSVVQNRPIMNAAAGYRSIKEVLNLPETAFVFLYQGGLQRGRGLEEIIDAAREIDNAHFVFIGGGALAEELAELAGVSEAACRIHFLPAVPWEELIEWTRSADAGLQLLQNTCLNHYTTDSNKLFEYGLAGLPVLASDFPEIRKVLSAHRFGILVDPADRSAVVREMRRLIADVELRNRLSRAAREAGNLLSWSSQEKTLLDVYERILNEGR